MMFFLVGSFEGGATITKGSEEKKICVIRPFYIILIVFDTE